MRLLVFLLTLMTAAASFSQTVIFGSDKPEDRANRLTILVVGDKWPDARSFQDASKRLVRGLFGIDPLKDLKDLFVVVAVDPEPPPAAAGDDEEAPETPATPAEPPRPYYQSRVELAPDADVEGNLLVQPGGRVWFGDDLAEACQRLQDTHPEVPRQAVLVLLNNDGSAGGGRFGDGGAPGLCAVTSGASAELAAHMLGHALFGLADEYANREETEPPDDEPEEPNVTRDPTGAKWNRLVDAKFAKPVEGARFCLKGVYRPEPGCVMNKDRSHFCAVCKERILARAYEIVSVIDRVEPGERELALTTAQGLKARVETVGPAKAAIEGEWFLDGQRIATAAPKPGAPFELDFAPGQLAAGQHVLRFLASDPTIFGGPKANRPRRPLNQRDWYIRVTGTKLPALTPRSGP